MGNFHHLALRRLLRSDLFDQLQLGLALYFDRLVSQANRFDECFFLDLVGFAFHHHDVVHVGGDNNIQVGLGYLRTFRIDQVFTLDAGDAHFRNRSLKGNIGHHHRGTGGQGGEGIGKGFAVSRDQVDDNLGIEHIPIGEQRANSPVHQSGDQDLFIGKTSFPTEEVTRNATGGREFFLVVDG